MASDIIFILFFYLFIKLFTSNIFLAGYRNTQSQIAMTQHIIKGSHKPVLETYVTKQVLEMYYRFYISTSGGPPIPYINMSTFLFHFVLLNYYTMHEF